MDNMRAKLRRKLSMHDKAANIDEHDDYDEETTGYLHKEIDEAENSNHPEGRPGSFLNRLISHGNKTTEEQIKKEMEAEQAAKQQRTKT